MFNRRRFRDVPSLNTTSTADISFMLLVFFLVTSSMDTDKGLGRQLAPLNPEQQEQRDINRSNVLQLRISADNAIFCDEKPVTMAELQRTVESFVASRPTNEYIISVEADRKASYNTYFELQNSIVAAYHRLRNMAALHQYGHAFRQCSEEERQAIMQRYPQRISEGMQEGGDR